MDSVALISVGLSSIQASSCSYMSLRSYHLHIVILCLLQDWDLGRCRGEAKSVIRLSLMCLLSLLSLRLVTSFHDLTNGFVHLQHGKVSTSRYHAKRDHSCSTTVIATQWPSSREGPRREESRWYTSRTAWELILINTVSAMLVRVRTKSSVQPNQQCITGGMCWRIDDTRCAHRPSS